MLSAIKDFCLAAVNLVNRVYELIPEDWISGCLLSRDGPWKRTKGNLQGYLGWNPPRFSVPVGPARFMVGLMEDTFRLVGRKSPISWDTIDKYTEDIAVDSRLIQRELGFKPEFDLKTGWKETVEEMRCMGYL